MACFAHLVLFFILLFLTVTNIEATASVSVRLVKYDTNWQRCGFFDGLCDPGFEICLNGLQIEVDVISNCSSVEATDYATVRIEYDTSATTDPTNAFTLNITDPWNTHRETTVWMQETTDTYYDKYINVNCKERNWYIKLDSRPLKQQFQDFNTKDVYLGRDLCTGYEFGDFILFDEEYNSCFTNKSIANDTVIFTNTLVYALHDPDHHYLIRDYRFKINVKCNTFNHGNGVTNMTTNNNGQENYTDAGTENYSIQLKFYQDSNYQHMFTGFPPSYMIGDFVYVKAQSSILDSDIKMRLVDCYTKPSKQASNIFTYYLIREGCPIDRNTFVTSKSWNETRFYFQDFEYAGHPDSMFVHCNATFCTELDWSSECEPQCGHRKRIGYHNYSRNGNIDFAEDEAKLLFTYEKDSTPKKYRMNSDSSNGTSSKIRPLYVAGVIIVALAMICVLVALTIYFRRKKFRNISRIV